MTDPASSEGPLQFGRRDPGLSYRDRPTAHGVATRDDGRIACVRITKDGEPPYIDLPGGALDLGEDAPTALVREFAEETGLRVSAGRLLVVCAQYMRMESGEPVNNASRLFEAVVAGEDPGAKIEDDHALIWLQPLEALSRLRLDSQAYAVAALASRAALEAGRYRKFQPVGQDGRSATLEASCPISASRRLWSPSRARPPEAVACSARSSPRSRVPNWLSR